MPLAFDMDSFGKDDCDTDTGEGVEESIEWNKKATAGFVQTHDGQTANDR